MELEFGHRGHLYVGDQTGDFGKAMGCEEISSQWGSHERRQVQRAERESCGGAGGLGERGRWKILAPFAFSDFA